MMDIEAIVKKRMGHHYTLKETGEESVSNEALIKRLDEYLTDRIDHYGPLSVPDARLFSDIRLALTELAAGYEQRIRQLSDTHAIEQRACNKLAHDHGFLLAEREHLQERIRQLEAERVPDGWEVEDVQEIVGNLKKSSRSAFLAGESNAPADRRFVHRSCVIAWQFLDDLLAAAPQQKKEGE